MTGVLAALLPATVLVLLPYVSRADGLRAALLRALLLASVIVVAATEVLSLVEGLRRWVVVLFWFAVVLTALGRSLRDRDDGRSLVRTWRFVGERLRDGGARALRTPSVVVMGVVVLAVLAMTFVVAVSSPPNNWDSMTYHLPRVMHWAADHDLRNYRTTIDRQLYLGPLAEYVILHVYLLTGSDQLFNTVQWAALCGCVITASVIAKQLGGDRRAQALAAVATVTIPMGILQASTTQNDLVEALFLLLLVHACLAWRTLENPQPRDAWQVGAALGLALMAKNTGAIYAGPFLVLALAPSWRRPRSLVAPAALALGVAIALNLGQAVRNELTFHSPLGSKTTTAAVSNTHFSPGVTWVQSLRLFSSAATTSHPSVNSRLLGLVSHGTDLTGVSPTDPGLLYGATSYSLTWRVQEDFAGFPAQVWAAVIVAGAALLRVRQRRDLAAAYVLAASVSFLLLATYLRWQPWGNRLDLPLIVTWMPVVAVALVSWARWLALPATIAFAWLTPTFLLHNEIRPLEGPTSVLRASDTSLLFASRPELVAPYQTVAAAINASGAKRVGLIEGADDWEYPLWRLTGGALHGRRFVDVSAADLHGAKVPSYDIAVCTDVAPGACQQLARPGWTLQPISAGVYLATRS